MSASPAVAVYSKPDCVQCDYTYKALDERGIEYKVVDITQDTAALAFVRKLGYLQAPVVVAGTDHWSGFKPDRIAALHAPRTSIDGAPSRSTAPATVGLTR